MSIADFAVTRRVTVAMLATAIVVLGLFAIPRLPIALLPSFQPPVVSVTVNYGNVSPETMESTVTRPLENAVSRVSGIDYLQSNSFTGQSTIRATFKFGTNINVAATDIQQQVARAATQLPNDPLLQQPQIQKADPNSIPVVRLSVTDPSRQLRDLYDLFNNQLADEFAGVAGVGSVSVFGGAQRAIMVQPDANVLAGYGLDTNAVVSKIKNENVDAPAGVLAIGPKEFVIRANALYKNADQVANTVLTVKNGAPIYIRDVAKVSDSIQEVRSFSRLDGVSSIAMSVTAQPDANVIAVSQGVYAKIADFQRRYPTMHFGVVFDQQGFIRDAVDALMHTAVYGAILAVLIILLFLHSLRSTLIVAISLPISVLGTLFAAYMLNQTLNIMTLGGLALAVGLIVDDAVVVIENIYRHLADGESPREAARSATSQIFSAVLASTVTVVTVFVPLLLIPGLQGLIFGPFALVIIVGVAISLLVATTTVPMLSSIMLDAHTVHVAEGDAAGSRNAYERFSAGFDRLYGRLEGGYRRLLGNAIDRPGLVLGLGVVLLALAVVAVKAGVVKTETFPASSSRFVQVNVRTPNGTAVANTNEVSKKVEDAIRSDPRVADVSATVGSAFGGGTTRIVTNQASMSVALKPGISGSAADAFVAQWTQRLGGTARRGTAAANASRATTNANISPEQRAKLRALRQALIGTTAFVSAIDIVQRVVSQGSDAVEIQLYGPDTTKLYTMAQSDLIPEIAQIPGIGRPDTNISPSQPEVDINVDRRVAAQLGFSTGEIATLISTATSGTIASYWQTNGTQYPIMVQLPPAQRRSLDALGSLLINPPGAAAGAAATAGSGGTAGVPTTGASSQSLNAVPLSGVAQISLGTGPSQIPRQNKARYVSITAPLSGNAVLGDVLGKITDVMNGYPLPSGYRWQYGPAITQNNDTFAALTLVVILAIALIYMLLASQFESFLDPLVIMMAVPFALIGIIASLWITHRAFGLTAFIGSLMLVGIAVKNAILVVEFTKQLRRDEGLDPREALMHAGPMRLRPILMTTLATLGGMLPIALGIEAGSQTQAPLGTVVIGGLMTSTLLSLVVVPTIYLWVARHVEPRFAPKPPSLRRRPRTDGRATVEEPQPAPARSRVGHQANGNFFSRGVNPREMRSILDRYAPAPAFDEFAGDDGRPRPYYEALAATLEGISSTDFRHRVTRINDVLLRRGVTFTVYSDARGTERILPFDLIPRIVPASDWDCISRGIAQRVRALNAFLNDVYGEARCLRDGIVPRGLVYSSPHYEREAIGVQPPRGVYIHVSGIDLVRDAHGTFLVLEDNVRTPSGISYVLENRDVLKRSFPRLFEGYDPLPVDDYPRRLRDALLASAPAHVADPVIALLTPGIYNSAYFEHTLLARRMGVELVEGSDLFVRDNMVYAKTTRGPQRIDVIYRRVDDDFIDPLYFRADSALGVPGLFDAYRAGNVTLANAVGTGVADDKAIYMYVPAMIRYYLGEEPVLDNVPTYDCSVAKQRSHVLANLETLVVKRTSASGGYGMLIGPMSTAEQRAEFADAVRAKPREFIAQPVVTLSAHPTVVEDGLAPRHVDLRPFALLAGDRVDVPPAALTRVALVEGSLVVNSSQGGGSKDTWVLGD